MLGPCMLAKLNKGRCFCPIKPMPGFNIVFTSGMPDPAAAGAKAYTSIPEINAHSVPKPTLNAYLGCLNRLAILAETGLRNKQLLMIAEGKKRVKKKDVPYVSTYWL